jgi:two-component system sensor histidine kinase HydH
MTDVLKGLIRESSLLAPDFRSFKRQESTFVVLNLILLAALLLIHTLFASYLGTPSPILVVVLSVGFLLNVAELVWLQKAQSVTGAGMSLLTWLTIALNMVLAYALAFLSQRQDAQYFALLGVPIVKAAFRFSLPATVAIVASGAALDFLWVWEYFRIYPPGQASAYIEAGTVSLIFAIVGVLVWILVNHLRIKEAELTNSLTELEQTRELLSIEERLAAVGRFSSAIAHEIRNPVAMISSALATAFRGELAPPERQEMFEIAAKEASRLEKLTSDFLAYARPRAPLKEPSNVAESVAYVADVCRPHAAERSVTIEIETAGKLQADVDSGQVQQALLNLVMNAVDASPPGAVVHLRGQSDNGIVRIDVENPEGPIPPEAVDYIFEPFFTTKSGGTGLGVPIARSVARAHGGDLVLSRNEPGAVRFSITLPGCTGDAERA